MPSVSIHGLRTGLNSYHWYESAEIKIKTNAGESIAIRVKDGDYQEKKSWVDQKGNKCRSLFTPGIGFREWKNNRLTIKENYSSETLRSRIGVAQYKKSLYSFTVLHRQKRYNRGSFGWEEVYWSNGQLMYRYKKNQKNGEFFRPDGSLWGRYEGKLNWEYRYRDCIAFPHWRQTKLIELYRDGPELNSHPSSSFTWFDNKGKVWWQGQFENGQKTGVWIQNYIECVFIRGVSVPKSFADAKPEDIDVYKVVREKNAQLRAVLIEKIGINRVINELQGEIIDEDKDNDFSLINIRLAAIEDRTFRGDKTINLLKVKCPSTGAFYTLRVPPGIKSVYTARQWTFGVEIDNDSNLREETLEFVKET
jgi:hypothetical protein